MNSWTLAGFSERTPSGFQDKTPERFAEAACGGIVVGNAGEFLKIIRTTIKLLF